MFDLPIPEGWRLVKLSDLGEVNRGRSRHRPRDAAHLYGGPYPFVQTGDVKASQGRVTSYTQTYSEDGLAQSRLWPKETMCITIAANIAETGILQFPACFPDSVIGFIPDESKCNVYFIEYVFRLLRRRIQVQATGSVQDNINLQTLERLHFPVPELDEQNRIADVLCSFDDKIELNRQTNQTLEHIAQAIFKSWFVDFEPTRAKAQVRASVAEGKMPGSDQNLPPVFSKDDEERLVERAAMAAISGKSLDELDQLTPEQQEQLKTTAALFPDALVDAAHGSANAAGGRMPGAAQELGEIPEGWEWSEIGNEVDVVGGGTPSTKKEEYWEGGRINWTSPKDMSNLTDKILLETDRKITEAGLAKISSGLLPENTVLMSSRAPVGYLAISKIPVAVNQGYIAMKCEGRLTPEYVVQWADSVMDDIKQRASGTTFAEISKKNFKIMPVIVPERAVVAEFTKVISELYEKITESLNETKSLTQTRDALLPKLLSGELHISSEAAA